MDAQIGLPALNLLISCKPAVHEKLHILVTSVPCVSMHRQCKAERSGAQFRGTEHILRTAIFTAKPSANFEFVKQEKVAEVPSGRTGVSPNGHFECLGGARAGSSRHFARFPDSHFERSGGIGAGPSGHFERGGSSGQPFRTFWVILEHLWDY